MFATLSSVALWAALLLTLAPAVRAEPGLLPIRSGSLMVTHASRHYHTDPRTIAATNALVTAAASEGRDVYALAQLPIAEDPDWYTARDEMITASIYSHAGEHQFAPKADGEEPFRVTAIGGYHSACLGWTVAELVSRFLENPRGREIEVILPMTAIFTGFLRQDGRLVPETPGDEAIADDSVDGMNLADVTAAMSDDEWLAFMIPSLELAVFDNAPMYWIRRQDVVYQLRRDGRLLHTFTRTDAEPASSPSKVVTFSYESFSSNLKAIRN